MNPKHENLHYIDLGASLCKFNDVIKTRKQGDMGAWFPFDKGQFTMEYGRFMILQVSVHLVNHLQYNFCCYFVGVPSIQDVSNCECKI